MEKPATVECYELDKQLRAGKTAKTTDGWVIENHGQNLNPRSQSVSATKGGKRITYSHYWGSEAIAQVLLKARNEILPNSKY